MMRRKFRSWRRALLAVLSAWAMTMNAPAEDVVSGEYGRKLDEYLTRLESLGISGAYLVRKDGEQILAKGYGLADQASGEPYTRGTVSTVGSITKQFTGAAILKLETEGRLSVKDKIGKYFDDVPKDKRAITIHHLLTHTSGLRGSYADDFSPVTTEKFLERAMKNRLKFEVGERHYYSNAGYSLLGMIIEKVTGGSYEEYLRKAFFDPLGMDDTGYLLPEWGEGEVAVGYEDGERWGSIRDHRWAADGPYWGLRANGGILSTVDDLYTWHLALKNDVALPADARKRLFTRYVPENPNDENPTWFYGYGWAVATTERDTTLISHNGGNGIFFADFRWYVEDEVTLIYFTNTAEKFSGENERDLRRILFDHPYELPTALSEE